MKTITRVWVSADTRSHRYAHEQKGRGSRHPPPAAAPDLHLLRRSAAARRDSAVDTAPRRAQSQSRRLTALHAQECGKRGAGAICWPVRRSHPIHKTAYSGRVKRSLNGGHCRRQRTDRYQFRCGIDKPMNDRASQSMNDSDGM